MNQRIGNKIIIVYGIGTIIVLLCLLGFYVLQQEKSTRLQNELTMAKVAESMTQGLYSIMLAGNAEIAKDYADRLENVADIIEFKIIRDNGLQAFLDNRTIEKVNAMLGKDKFLNRDDELLYRVFDLDDKHLQQVRASMAILPMYQTSVTGEHQLVLVAPIIGDDACGRCHGKANQIRGFVKLTTSLASVDDLIRQGRERALIVSVFMLLAILGATALFVTRTAVVPLRSVAEAMLPAAKERID